MSIFKTLDRSGGARRKGLLFLALTAFLSLLHAAPAAASEAELKLPDLGSVAFHGINGRNLLLGGLLVCLVGLVFGLVIYTQLKNLPVHRSMLEISELIYETCKTYLLTQGKFILLLEVFIGVDHRRSTSACCGTSTPLKVVDHPAVQPDRHRRQLRRRLVRHPRQHLRQLAHRVRQPARQAVSRCYAIPLQAGMSIGMLLISVELVHDARASCCSSRATTPAPASSASPSASRSAPRRCASPAASSPRSPTSAPT